MLISINLSSNAAFLGSDKPRVLLFPLIHVKTPTIVVIFTFMSRKKFMLSCVEHEKCFITSRPGPEVIKLFLYSTQLSMKFKMLISMKISRNAAFFRLR